MNLSAPQRVAPAEAPRRWHPRIRTHPGRADVQDARPRLAAAAGTVRRHDGGAAALSISKGVVTLPRASDKALLDLPWGSHVCQFYDSKQDQLDMLRAVFQAGAGTERSVRVAGRRPDGRGSAQKHSPLPCRIWRPTWPEGRCRSCTTASSAIRTTKQQEGHHQLLNSL